MANRNTAANCLSHINLVLVVLAGIIFFLSFRVYDPAFTLASLLVIINGLLFIWRSNFSKKVLWALLFLNAFLLSVVVYDFGKEFFFSVEEIPYDDLERAFMPFMNGLFFLIGLVFLLNCSVLMRQIKK